MPQAIAFITPYVANFLFAIGGNYLAAVATGLVASALVYGGLAVGAYLLQAATAPQKPEAPKPEDGKYALKQSVPPLSYILGGVQKSGDYALLEERAGVAYHIVVDAAHSIHRYAFHLLHDEIVTLDSNGYVVAPEHFAGGGVVRIETRLGAAVSTAYAEVVAAFPEIWTSAHRGDGLASTQMTVRSVSAEELQRVFPQGMPQRSSIIEGHNQLIDPRTGVPGYSTNVALFRYWHLAHPVGGKLAIGDLYAPDWAHAADVCDQDVTNRTGGIKKRYHGGLWFRATNDPVQIGRLMDQAAEMVIYERADGTVGVHAGEYVAPDIRLTANDLISVSYDANRRKGSNVLAVRGRYTDPGKGYNTVDAAIYGDPYVDDTERTKTVENQAVQDHNHMARLQKLAFIRANAPRVKLVAHYEAARQVPYRRFVTIHYPPKMTEALVEIIGRPTLSLRNLTYTFEGIVLPGNPYLFNAATEEGVPGASVIPIEREDVPAPEDFVVTIQNEDVGGGSSAAYARATFTLQSSTFQYEMQWEPTAGGAVQSVRGDGGAITLRTTYLADGVQYKFRARTWSVGVPSDWTGYQILTATADGTPPGVVTGVSATGGVGDITFNWTAPNSGNYVGSRLYWNTSNTMVGATLVATEFGAPNTADSRTLGGFATGTYYGFVVAINGSGVAAAAVATGAVSSVPLFRGDDTIIKADSTTHTADEF